MSSAKVTDLPSLGPHLAGGSLQATEAEPDIDRLLTFRPAPTLPLNFSPHIKRTALLSNSSDLGNHYQYRLLAAFGKPQKWRSGMG